MSKAYVNPEIIRWARERLALDVTDLDRMVANVPADRLADWEHGAEFPTFRQARELAGRLKIPLGYLFLDAPPHESLPLADFRRPADRLSAPLGADARQFIDDAIAKQEWFREYRILEGAEPISWVGVARRERADPRRLAREISDVFSLDDLRATSTDTASFFRLAVQAADRLGVTVLRSGVVRSNTRRIVPASEVQGFALSDAYAPFVFVNSRDFPAAQSFTLFHEIAHLWLGESGISRQDLFAEGESLGSELSETDRLESLCNRTAAECLVPSEAFSEQWRAHKRPVTELRALARWFRTSQIVVLRRALEEDFLSHDDFFRLLPGIRDSRPRASKSSGGDFHATFRARNGMGFTRAVLSSALEGKTLFREAGQLLGVKKVETLLQEAREMGLQ